MISLLKNLFKNDDVDHREAIEKGAVIIDVRTPGEFRDGHLDKAVNIPLSEITSQVEMIRKWNKPVITVCRSGARSGIAKNILEQSGIKTTNGGAWNHFKLK